MHIYNRSTAALSTTQATPKWNANFLYRDGNVRYPSSTTSSYMNTQSIRCTHTYFTMIENLKNLTLSPQERDLSFFPSFVFFLISDASEFALDRKIVGVPWGVGTPVLSDPDERLSSSVLRWSDFVFNNANIWVREKQVPSSTSRTGVNLDTCVPELAGHPLVSVWHDCLRLAGE